MKNTAYYISWTAQIVAAIILAQTLFFKFTGAPESVAIFMKLGVEPNGRIVAGVLELITVGLLLTSRTAIYGALLGVGILSGAILAHLFVIGIESAGDGGQLFALAIITFVCCILVVYIRKLEVLAFFYTLSQRL
jgi:hypothetical protein